MAVQQDRQYELGSPRHRTTVNGGVDRSTNGVILPFSQHNGLAIETPGNIQTASLSADAAADRYAAIWKNNPRRYGSHGARVRPTKLFNTVVERLTAEALEAHEPWVVIDAGAGNGDASRRYARSLRDAEVIAVEYSTDAAAGIERSVQKGRSRFAEGSDVKVVAGKITPYLMDRDPSQPVKLVGADSLLHFFSQPDREEVYEGLDRVGAEYVAFSLKGDRDSLLGLKGTEVTSRDEKWIQAVPPDGIARSFLVDPNAFVRELQRQYDILAVLRWRRGRYDFPDRPDLKADFWGFFAKRRTA